MSSNRIGQRKNFIKGAINKPGQLHKDLGIPEGEKIPEDKIEAAASGQYGSKVSQRARFAKTLKSMKK